MGNHLRVDALSAGMYCQKLTNPTCPKNNEERKKRKNIRRNHLMENASIVAEKSIEFLSIEQK